MSGGRQALVWAAGVLLFGLALHLLSPILLPFVAAPGIAYFCDPAVDRLERAGCGRTLATALVLALFLLVLVVALFVLVPLLQAQIVAFAGQVPGLIRALQGRFAELFAAVNAQLSPDDVQRLKDAAGGFAGDALSLFGQLLGGIWSGGLALVNLLSLIFIMPVVAFYLLRDWDRIVAVLDSWLPREHAPVIRALAAEADEMIGGFVRGVGTVCLILAVFYGVALSLVGLQFGLVIGLAAGLLSFIPFVGAIAGFVVAVGVALVQFEAWSPVALVAGVFILGQAVEGNFLTPRLVGGRIRLHPVWVIFALLAGGLLFGFVGVLLAVPAAAVIGVLVRFGVARYLKSPIYTGAPGRQRGGAGQDDDPEPGRP